MSVELSLQVPLIYLLATYETDAQVTEIISDPVAKKLAEKKKLVKEKDELSKRVKKAKKERYPTRPKRPPIAFFLFMDKLRVTFKAENPDNKKIYMFAKEGDEKLKSMTDEEKEPFTTTVAELKEEYRKALEASNGNDKEDDNEGSPDKAEVDTNEDEECSPDKVDEVDEIKEGGDQWNLIHLFANSWIITEKCM